MVKDMTNGSPSKHILGFAVPMLFGMLFQQFYNLVDTIIVGKTLGVEALAGVGATGSINFMIIGFCMGVCNGFVIPVAQCFGAKKPADLRKYVFNGYICSIVFAIVLTLASVIFCRRILIIMNTPADIIDHAYNYIVVIFIGIPTVFLYNMVSGVIRSLGDSKTPVVFLVLSSIINVVLDFFLILVCKMGVAGAGWATVTSQLISGLTCLIYMYKKYDILKGDKSERVLDRRFITNLCMNGVPMGLQYSITAIGSTILQAAVNTLGSTYVAAMIIGSIYSVLSLVALYFTTDYIALLFVNASETTIIALTRQFILASACFYIPLTGVNVVRFCIQGMGFSVFAISAGILEMIGRAFAAIILIPSIGFMGACLASPIAWIAADAFLFPAFIHCAKKLNARHNIKSN